MSLLVLKVPRMVHNEKIAEGRASSRVTVPKTPVESSAALPCFLGIASSDALLCVPVSSVAAPEVYSA